MNSTLAVHIAIIINIIIVFIVGRWAFKSRNTKPSNDGWIHPDREGWNAPESSVYYNKKKR